MIHASIIFPFWRFQQKNRQKLTRKNRLGQGWSGGSLLAAVEESPGLDADGVHAAYASPMQCWIPWVEKDKEHEPSAQFEIEIRMFVETC